MWGDVLFGSGVFCFFQRSLSHCVESPESGIDYRARLEL